MLESIPNSLKAGLLGLFGAGTIGAAWLLNEKPAEPAPPVAELSETVSEPAPAPQASASEPQAEPSAEASEDGSATESPASEDEAAQNKEKS